MNARTHIATISLVALVGACGTVAGNPKKPASPTPTQQQPGEVYALPLVEYQVPDDAAADDAALNLTAVDATDEPSAAQGDKSVLKQWAQRTGRIMTQIDAFTTRVNKIIVKERETNQAEVLTFTRGSGDSAFNGKIAPVADEAGGFAYRATLCRAGKVFLDFRWSKDGKTIALTKDFSSAGDGEDQPFSLKSRVSVQKGDDLTLDLLTDGQWSDSSLDSEDGHGLTEKAHSVRKASGEVTIAVTGDKYETAPAAGAFEGDYYLSGRLLPLDEASKAAAKRNFTTEFVGYFKGFKLLCRNGFDETDASIWTPDGVGARFCIGRPRNAKIFKSVAQFRDTVHSLEDVGIVKKAELESVSFEADASCE